MTFTPGTRLGPYEIVAPLGAGGMGEVFRARDTRLGREVAIKALPVAFAQEPERLARFEREARILASLSHPNIAGILGLEEVGGARYLVLELVEGETLAARLSRGALPLDETLEAAKQIAAGVEAAHESGVVHRDLKPGNIMLTSSGAVKVLDFGLARTGATDRSGSDLGLSASPTMTYAATQAGVILGTAAYMSPEQARGKSVDRRTDIWSFGCIVFECLTGRVLFQGETVSDLIASILQREPDWDALPQNTPPRLRELLARCLRKDARERLRDIGDARLQLSEVFAMAPDMASAGPTSRRAPAWAWLLVGVAGVALGLVAGGRLGGPLEPPASVRRFTIPADQFKGEFFNHPSLSPDGRRVVFGNGSQLWIRELARFESVVVPGTEGASMPFWSPDGSKLGFAKENKLWIATLSESKVIPLTEIPGAGVCVGATWGRDGKIVMALFRGGLYEVSALGGELRLILAPDSTEVDFHLPDRLGDGEWIITTGHAKVGPHPIVLVSPRDGSRKNLGKFEGLNNVVYSATGHLLLNIQSGRSQIMAIPFSDAKREITGEPFLVAAGGAFPSVSIDGVLTYILSASHNLRELVWLGRDGRIEQVAGPPQRGLDLPALSPDGASVALVAYEKDNSDIWLQDLARGTRRRLVSGPGDEDFPTWSDQGRQLVYGEHGNVEPILMEISVDGSDVPRSLGTAGSWPTFSPDGRTIVFNRDISGQEVLWRLDRVAGAEPIRLTTSPTTNENAPTFSPDGRWLAYMSDESGEDRTFVRRFPDGAEKQQVSLGVGEFPFWSRDGQALYYWERGTLMEIPTRMGEKLNLGTPKKLFNATESGIILGSGFP
ncbi:MAG: protein kinase, partial [Candidatus Eisenbacteria bacterium]|nr:protein kinase [Candidatus Eisenbacteria bacterium]